MTLRTLTWNIGGGKFLEHGQDPGLMSSYNIDGIDVIAEQIAQSDAQIITIQEAHGNDDDNQVAHIARKLGYEYFYFDAITDSHIDPSFKLGNGIISKFPMSDVRVGRFYNPDVDFEMEGKRHHTHDKGYVTCTILMNEKAVLVSSVHLIPFKFVGLTFDSDVTKRILSSVSVALQDIHEAPYGLIQGDFNINSAEVKKYVRDLFIDNRMNEITLVEPTTPKDRMYDHVLFKGIELSGLNVDSNVLTDHYPVICDFEIEQLHSLKR